MAAEMRYRRLGRSGLKVSALSYGSWLTFAERIDAAGAEDCLKAAYEAGVNFFDNAEAYAEGRSEALMGEILAKLGWPRETYLVSSKVFWGGPKPNQTGLSLKHVVEACHAALRRLRVDYLDLYFCHRPDPETPIEETVRAMDLLQRQGKILYWGTSEWSAQEIMQAHGLARQLGAAPPSVEQPLYNLLNRHRVEEEYRRLYAEIGLGATTWSPLASGILTGKYRDGVPEGSRLSLPKADWLRERLERYRQRGLPELLSQLEAVAAKIGASPAQLAIAWCLKNPDVSSVILGAARPEQLAENLGALDALDALDEDFMGEIDIALSRFKDIDA